ncbi:hypothetical protein [Paenibacillus sophorae]|uniref:Uncharacterized protein n=1 Tax=Paenibacillus sophorae TaxID=1333845 RepID=A0ABX8HEU8_9BACL|nr:hypothetical protein [Paenibacillus sophorae]QWU16794.1 hypothetical protein KP014_06175 [Paenibacillus sophorae]
MMSRKKPSSSERSKALDLLRKSGIERIVPKKGLASPYYSSVGRSKKGRMEIRDF